MELSAARTALHAACAALDQQFQGKYFLTDGTLLGHVRDGGFILGDYDIDLGMRIAEFNEALVADMQAAGFGLLRRDGSPDDGLVLQFMRDGVRLDLLFFYPDDQGLKVTHHLRGKRLVARFPDFALRPARFEGAEVMIPSPPEPYLVTAYGHDWRRPVRVWDYRYATRNIRPEGNLLWRAHSRLKRRLWRWRQGDIHRRGLTVFTDGVFDLLHANHIALLEEARAMGDRLLVGVISDRIAASYKRHPVVPEAERLRMVKALRCVDQAVLLDDTLADPLMRQLIGTHDIGLVVYAGHATPEFYTLPEQTGIMRRLPYRDGVSSTGLIDRITARGAQGDL
ncbi:adenylyltransferase/cytidyltransferase family protein [Halovulum sp. GXIMD14793]